MKNTVRIATLAALVAAAPAFGATTPRKAPVAPAAPASALMQAYTALNTELKDVLGGARSDMVVRLDKLRDITLTAPTKAKVQQILGASMPSGIERQPNSGGGFDYSFAMTPGSYTDPEGGGASWSQLAITESMDKDALNASGNLRWDRLDVNGKTLHVAVRDMRIDGRQQRTAAGTELWTGNSSGGAGSVLLEDSSMPGFSMRFDDIRVNATSSARGKLLDLTYQSGIKSISLLGGQVDDVRINFRMLGLDMAFLGKLNAAKKGAVALTPQQQLEAMLPTLRAFAQSARSSDTALEIDDYSMAYMGNRLALNGRITFAPGTDKDFATMASLGKKIDAELTLTVPTALVLDVAKLFARKQMSANPQAVVDDAAVTQMAQSMRDMVIGKVMTSGFGRMENDNVIIPIEVHEGVITLNGKVIELPKAPAAPAQPAAKGKSKKK